MAGEKPKKRVKELRVNEISLVDEPAVPKARFLIVKRRDKGGGATMSAQEDRGFSCDGEGVVLDKAGEYGYSDEQPRSPMEAAEKLVGMLMTMRRSLPTAIRRQVMELDLSIDELTRSAEKQEKPEEGEEEEKKQKPEGEKEEETKQKPEEGKEEEEAKAAGDKPGTGKKPPPQAAIPGFEKKEGEEEAEKKQTPEGEEEAEKKAPEGEEAEKKSKEKQRKECPPGMVFDEEKGKCVPQRAKQKKGEKSQEEEIDTTGLEDLELTAEETSRVEKLIERLK